MNTKSLKQKLLAGLALTTLCTSLAAGTTHHSGGKSSADSGHESKPKSATHAKSSTKTSTKSSSKSSKTSKSGAKSKKTSAQGSAPCHTKKCAKVSKKGQQKIDSARATEIQQALQKAGYMSGEPSGDWDGASQTAMLKFQADNGWQTKVTPDSRALIKLGLGPSQEGLINPETAMTALPEHGNVKSGPDAPQR